MLRLSYQVLQLLPMWEYICPKCRRIVKANSHKCVHCGEKYRGLKIRVPPTFLKSYKALEKFMHKYVLPRVSDKMRSFLTKYFTIFFTDGFESGTTNAWQTTEAGFTVVTLHPFQGNYCGQAIAPASFPCRVINNGTLPLSPIMYHRAYYYLDPTALPTSGTFNEFIYGGTSSSISGDDSVRVALQGDGAGNNFWSIDYLISGAETIVNENVASNPTSGQWYSVEILRDLTHQVAELWVNGIQKVLVTGLAQVNNSDGIFEGIEFNPNSSAATVWVDAVVASDTYNGPVPTTVTTVPMTYGDGLTSYTC
jgi:hypothetical protein